MTTVNLVIDVGQPEDTVPGPGQPPAPNAGFNRAIQDSVAALRAQGVPTIWVTMGKGYRLIEPEKSWPQADAGPRSRLDLHRLGFDTVTPARDEAIFTKLFKGSFLSRDQAADPDVQQYLERQIPDQHMGGYDPSAGSRFDHIVANVAGLGSPDRLIDGPDLASHLRGMGCDHVTVMGVYLDHCVTDAALGSAAEGLRTTVVTDRVISSRDHAQTQSASANRDELESELEQARRSPGDRGLTKDQAARSSDIEFTSFSQLRRALVADAEHRPSAQEILSDQSKSPSERVTDLINGVLRPQAARLAARGNTTGHRLYAAMAERLEQRMDRSGGDRTTQLLDAVRADLAGFSAGAARQRAEGDGLAQDLCDWAAAAEQRAGRDDPAAPRETPVAAALGSSRSRAVSGRAPGAR